MIMKATLIQPKSFASTPDSDLSPGRSFAPPTFQLNASNVPDPPVQMKATGKNGGPVQRYPIAKKSTNRVESIKGRPNAKSNPGTIKAIVKQIFKRGAMNLLEQSLVNLGSPSKAYQAIVSGKFLSKNGAAICHKEAISQIESKLVGYANRILNSKSNQQLDANAIDYIKALTAKEPNRQQKCLSLLKTIQTVWTQNTSWQDEADQVADALSDLIRELDGSATNLYIGHSRSNSSIGHHFDPHYNVFSTNDPNATPNSMSIYNSQKKFSKRMKLQSSSPKRSYYQGEFYNQTSSLPNKDAIIYDFNKNPKL